MYITEQKTKVGILLKFLILNQNCKSLYYIGSNLENNQCHVSILSSGKTLQYSEVIIVVCKNSLIYKDHFPDYTAT